MVPGKTVSHYLIALCLREVLEARAKGRVKAPHTSHWVASTARGLKEENMKEIQFSIEINVSKERVWATLWEDVTFRDWANIIDEGTYMKGVMKEGTEIQFISSVNGYGVTSLIEKLNTNEFVLFRHSADTKEIGEQEREKEWTGGTESYSLAEKDGITTLTVKTDVPQEQEETFNIRLPKALERIKTLAEKK